MNKKIIGVTVGTTINPDILPGGQGGDVDEALDEILELQEQFKDGGATILEGIDTKFDEIDEDIDGRFAEVNEEMGNMLNKIYPVGSIYMSVNNTNPTSLFGGTWEQLKDRFLLGAGDTYAAGATGGDADAKLINHNHALISFGNGTVIGEAGVLTPDANGTYGRKINTEGAYFADDMKAAGRFITSAPKGLYPAEQEIINDGTGKNMPPYLAVYMWKRTA